MQKSCNIVIRTIWALLKIAIILFLLLYNIILYADLYMYKSSISNTHRYELDFYISILQATKNSKIVALDNLVPVEWDYVKVFYPYQTVEDKIEFVGYKYADYLTDLGDNGCLSLIFIRNERVVYFVDCLSDQTIEHIKLDNGLIRLKCNEYYIDVDSDAIGDLINWRFDPHIDCAFKTDSPYIMLSKIDDGFYSIIMDSLSNKEL